MTEQSLACFTDERQGVRGPKTGQFHTFPPSDGLEGLFKIRDQVI